MSKAYTVVTYHEINDPDRLAKYAAVAGPAMLAAGGNFLARGMPDTVYEHGKEQRVVVIEFESVEAARNAYESPAYKEALEILGDAAVRDFRIVPGA